MGAMTNQRRTDEDYGRLLEGLHIVGYTFARACNQLLGLLKGDRWKSCSAGFKDVNAFMDSVRLDELRASVDERKKIAAEIKRLQPKVSERQIGRTLGVSKDTVKRDLRGAKAPRPGKNQSKNNGSGNGAGAKAPGLSGSEAWKAAERAAAKAASQAAAEERREASRNAAPLPDGAQLRVGDCREVLADVASNSVALVLTDPPYAEESEPLYRWLAEWSARVLVPGGSLVLITGHWSLPRDVRIFDEHLRFWWMMAMTHKVSRRLPGKFVIAGFKPVLWYVKETRRSKTLIPDVLRDDGPDKDSHAWGQGEAGFTPLIRDLTAPGELIADPFAGAATWGRIAAGMGRRWIGADIVDGGSTEIEAREEEGHGERERPEARRADRAG
jgi:hypothetical protein